MNKEWDGLYCDAKEDEDPCPCCGATLSGNDPVRGVCQARYNRPRPTPLLEIVLIDRRTGKVV